MHLAGTRIPVGPFYATVQPCGDFETRSDAGFIWVPPGPPQIVFRPSPKRKGVPPGPPQIVFRPSPKRKGVPPPPGAGKWVTVQDPGYWDSLPGLSDQNRGLTAVGARNYIMHPSFWVLSLAYDLKDGRGVRQWIPPDESAIPIAAWPMDLLEHIARGGIFEAHNAMFEWLVWNLFCKPRWGWPELKLEQLRCSMAKCRAAAYPGKLEEAGKILLPEEMQKADGKALIKKLTQPKSPTKGNPALLWTRATAPEDFEKFDAYGRQDVVAESALSERVPDLSDRELEIWRFDMRRNFRGMQISLFDVGNCISIIEQAYDKYNAELFQITGGAVNKASEPAKILAWIKAKHGIRIAELDEETVEEALTRTYPAEVLRVLRIRQLLAFGSVKKLYAMRSHSTPDGRLCDQYTYYGAHTGLWNGRAVQPANLYKGQFSKPEQVELALSIIATRDLATAEAAYGDALECVADCLRSMIVAAPGHKLISADFTAIQAVVTAALAGEEWRLEVFRTHGKIYEAQAALLTGKSVEYYAQYRKENKKHHSDRQDWGKLPVLSGDFGAWIGGWKRFGADKILGDDAAIKAAILKTRASIPNIVEYWGGQTRNKFSREKYPGDPNAERAELYGLEGAAISAVLSPGKCFGYRQVRYQMYEDTLYCIPPSGDFIRYHTPRLEPSRREYACPWELELSYMGWSSTAGKGKGKAGWKQQKLYGGVLTQNVTSNQARQIQADALVALDTGRYPIVMDTHDEQVAEVPDRPEYNAEEYTKVVRDAVARACAKWAHTPDGRPWPISVPMAWEAYRYGKWED
jgi:DNA polymerase